MLLMQLLKKPKLPLKELQDYMFLLRMSNGV
jgi:hypothetical protein